MCFMIINKRLIHFSAGGTYVGSGFETPLEMCGKSLYLGGMGCAVTYPGYPCGCTGCIYPGG